MDIRAFNKDCDSSDKGNDSLLGRMPKGTKLFCEIELERSCEPGAEDIGTILFFGHAREDQANKIIEALKHQNSLFVRCSTEGRKGNECVHRKVDNMVILELRQSYHNVTHEQWKYIIEALRDRDVSISIVDGNIPPELWPFFGSESKVALPALAILCQGYLVARGRTDLLGLGGNLTLNAIPIPESSKAKVVDSDWWHLPFKGINLAEAVTRECRGIVPAEIARLITQLGGQDDSVVAAALRKIQDILEA